MRFKRSFSCSRDFSRLASLTSIRSSTGSSRLALPSLGLLARLARALAAPMSERARYIATYAALASPGQDPAELARRADAEIARGWHRAGRQRHLCMALGTPDRTASLASVTVPSLVLHGDRDTLLPLSHGRSTAEALGCPLLIQEGVAHDMPPRSWPQLLEALQGLCPGRPVPPA